MLVPVIYPAYQLDFYLFFLHAKRQQEKHANKKPDPT
jgi:hypothetical protein